MTDKHIMSLKQDLVMVGAELVAPALVGLEVVRSVNHDGIGQIPFEPLSFLITLSAMADSQKGRRVGEGHRGSLVLERVVRGRHAVQSPCRNCGSLDACAR